jgi:hypothetical protein
MIAPRINSLREIADRSMNPEDFWLNFRDFLDGFYRSPGESAISEEPVSLHGRMEGDHFDAYLAATGEHLAAKYRLAVPAWVRSPARILRSPYFAFGTHEGRMFLLVESPTAFRARNIFISADALNRA